MRIMVTDRMQACFSEAWWGEHDRRIDANESEDNEACDRTALQAVLDQIMSSGMLVPHPVFQLDGVFSQDGQLPARSPNPAAVRPAIPPIAGGAAGYP